MAGSAGGLAAGGAGAPAVRMVGITRRFGPVVANDGVDLEVRSGEIHCLLGENGAGKSTLMKILFGLLAPDSGSIELFGRPVRLRGPQDALACGVGMVHQHFMLAGRLTVAENMVAGLEPTRLGLLDSRRARRLVEEASRRFGLAVDPDRRVETLSVGEQQRVEILKALMRQARILILDEPTAVLTPQETEELFSVMRRLREQGHTLIFITHKLRETMAVADRVTVLRAGRNVGTFRPSETTPQELAERMVGRRVRLAPDKAPARRGEPVWALEDVTLRGPGGRARLSSVSLAVHAGEIVGVAGVEGNGQLELEEVACGLRVPDAGRVLLGGRPLGSGGPAAFLALGGAAIPSDRSRRGLAAGFSVEENTILGSQRRRPFVRRGFLQTGAVAEHARGLLLRFDVRAPGLRVPVEALSGGNQQKLLVGRELARNPRFILAAQPTRGIDVGATEQVHRELLERRAAGAGILLISTELEELFALSDRLVVLYEGRIVAEGPVEAFDERRLGLLMAGQSLPALQRAAGGG